MKEKILYFTMLLMLVLTGCSHNEEPPYVTGSPRDWTYEKEQIKFFINNVEQSVSKITVRSIGLNAPVDQFPWYVQTLSIVGLLKGNKVFKIQVEADVDRFEGTTIYNNKEYNVTGIYTGSPFEHYKDMGIIIYLEEKK